FAVRAGHLALDRALLSSFARFAVAGAILGAVLWFTARLAAAGLAQLATFRDEATLGLLIVTGAVVYAVCILALFGRRWLVSLVRRPAAQILHGTCRWLQPCERRFAPPREPLQYAGRNSHCNRRQDGCPNQIRRRTKRPPQGRRCADPRQGPLHRRRRAATGA